MKEKLVSPSWEHREPCAELLWEWRAYGEKIHPGALRRCPCLQQRSLSRREWGNWLAEEKQQGQQLFFLMREDGRMLGAVSIRPQEVGESLRINGHCGYGIRPSERKKGYAVRMLEMAVKRLEEQGIVAVIVACDRENIASAKVAERCGGIQIGEVFDPDTGGINRIFQIGGGKKVFTGGESPSCNQNENVVR